MYMYICFCKQTFIDKIYLNSNIFYLSKLNVTSFKIRYYIMKNVSYKSTQ